MPFAEALPSRGVRSYGTPVGDDVEDTEVGYQASAPRHTGGWSTLVGVAGLFILTVAAMSTYRGGANFSGEAGAALGRHVVLNLAKGSKDGGAGGGDKFTHMESEDTILQAEEEDEEISEGDFGFSLQRQNYELYPYFGSSPDQYTKYAFLQAHDAIIEPSQSTVLSLWGDVSSTSTFTFTLCSTEDSEDCYEGTYGDDEEGAVKVACSPFDTFTLSVSEKDSDGKIVSESTGSAICMYVRREIRSLTSEDLDATMDAMYALWDTDEEEGQELYGENFHSSSYFAAAHDFNAAQQDSDHIHEGLGFLPQHIKLTNMFESAVQAVDPSIALPYWDFTIDVAQNLTIFESPMFTEDTFGSITPPSDHYWGFTWSDDSLADTRINDGRWKKTKAEVNTRYEGMSNGFGYMRGPWNTNPHKYISRFSAYSPSLPSCSDYYGGLGLPAFMQFLEDAPYGSHASTHGVIGAVFGCDLLHTYRESGLIVDEDSQLQICKKWGFYMKELYRANYIAPRDDCSYETLTKEGIDCGFVCNSDSYDDMISGIAETIGAQYVRAGMTDDDWGQFRDFICSGDGGLVFVGDHLESASPSDPSFWPIHPTQERLLQLKYMVGSVSGGGWPTDSKNDYVCDKAQCYESDYGSKDYYGMCCYGHYENDQLLDFVTGDKNSGYGLTNKQVLDYTDPTSEDYNMPYVFDHFKWEHCEEDFAGEIASLVEKEEQELSTPSPTPKSPTAAPSSTLLTESVVASVPTLAPTRDVEANSKKSRKSSKSKDKR